VEVVNKPVVKAKQRGQWDVTVNNDEANPVKVCDVCEEACQKQYFGTHSGLQIVQRDTNIVLISTTEWPEELTMTIKTISARAILYADNGQHLELRFPLPLHNKTGFIMQNVHIPLLSQGTIDLDPEVETKVGTINTDITVPYPDEASFRTLEAELLVRDLPAGVFQFIEVSVTGYFTPPQCE
jgi:hypothetical protein